MSLSANTTLSEDSYRDIQRRGQHTPDGQSRTPDRNFLDELPTPPPKDSPIGSGGVVTPGAPYGSPVHGTSPIRPHEPSDNVIQDDLCNNELAARVEALNTIKLVVEAINLAIDTATMRSSMPINMLELLNRLADPFSPFLGQLEITGDVPSVLPADRHAQAVRAVVTEAEELFGDAEETFGSPNIHDKTINMNGSDFCNITIEPHPTDNGPKKRLISGPSNLEKSPTDHVNSGVSPDQSTQGGKRKMVSADIPKNRPKKPTKGPKQGLEKKNWSNAQRRVQIKAAESEAKLPGDMDHQSNTPTHPKTRHYSEPSKLSAATPTRRAPPTTQDSTPKNKPRSKNESLAASPALKHNKTNAPKNATKGPASKPVTQPANKSTAGPNKMAKTCHFTTLGEMTGSRAVYEIEKAHPHTKGQIKISKSQDGTTSLSSSHPQTIATLKGVIKTSAGHFQARLKAPVRGKTTTIVLENAGELKADEQCRLASTYPQFIRFTQGPKPRSAGKLAPVEIEIHAPNNDVKNQIPKTVEINGKAIQPQILIGTGDLCYKCSKPNHMSHACRHHHSTCGVCSGQHDTKLCLNKAKTGQPTKMKCPMCNEAHRADKCPRFINQQAKHMNKLKKYDPQYVKRSVSGDLVTLDQFCRPTGHLKRPQNQPIPGLMDKVITRPLRAQSEFTGGPRLGAEEFPEIPRPQVHRNPMGKKHTKIQGEGLLNNPPWNQYRPTAAWGANQRPQTPQVAPNFNTEIMDSLAKSVASVVAQVAQVTQVLAQMQNAQNQR